MKGRPVRFEPWAPGAKTHDQHAGIRITKTRNRLAPVVAVRDTHGAFHERSARDKSPGGDNACNSPPHD